MLVEPVGTARHYRINTNCVELLPVRRRRRHGQARPAPIGAAHDDGAGDVVFVERRSPLVA